MHACRDEQGRINIVMEEEEADRIYEVIGQMTSSMKLESGYYEGSIMKIMKSGDYDDALPGFELPYEKAFDSIYEALSELFDD